LAYENICARKIVECDSGKENTILFFMYFLDFLLEIQLVN
jgi:hypothetical protein